MNDCSVFGSCATHGSQNAQLPPSVSSARSVGESRATDFQHFETASMVIRRSAGIRMNSEPNTSVEMNARGRLRHSAIVAQSRCRELRFAGSRSSHMGSLASKSSSISLSFS